MDIADIVRAMEKNKDNAFCKSCGSRHLDSVSRINQDTRCCHCGSMNIEHGRMISFISCDSCQFFNKDTENEKGVDDNV